MPTLLHFRARNEAPKRLCRNCFTVLRTGTPVHHRYCRSCYGFGIFHRAIEHMRSIGPRD